MNAGTIRELLARRGIVSGTYRNIKDYLMWYEVKINDVPTYEPERILEFGDVVSIPVEKLNIVI